MAISCTCLYMAIHTCVYMALACTSLCMVLTCACVYMTLACMWVRMEHWTCRWQRGMIEEHVQGIADNSTQTTIRPLQHIRCFGLWGVCLDRSWVFCKTYAAWHIRFPENRGVCCITSQLCRHTKMTVLPYQHKCIIHTKTTISPHQVDLPPHPAWLTAFHIYPNVTLSFAACLLHIEGSEYNFKIILYYTLSLQWMVRWFTRITW